MENSKINVKARLNAIIGYLNGKILDIGCNDCRLELKGAELGLDITGCDLSNRELKKGRQKAKELDLKISVMQCCAYDVGDKFKPESFDTIFMGELIEHLENPEEAITEALKLLKKTGKLIITTPCGFAHYSPDHRNFFFVNDRLKLLIKYWMLDFLPYMYLSTVKIIMVEKFFARIGYKTGIREMEWKESKHPSLDYLIVIDKAMPLPKIGKKENDEKQK